MLTGLLALGMLAFRADSVTLWPAGAYAPAFRGETKGPAAILNAHDGQAFGSLALDPLLSHPSEWSGGRAEMAYRAARPLFGWLVMLTSFGSPLVAQWSLLVWTAIGAGVLAAAAFTLADLWGRRNEWAPLLLLMPGVLGQLMMGGLSDGLAAGLSLFGLAWWLRGRDRRAVVLLSLAGLCRESALLVPMALLITAGMKRGKRLLVPLAVYAGWVVTVWLRLHATPGDPRQGRVGLPFAGLLSVVGSWGWAEVLCAVSVVAFGAVAAVRAPCREVRVLVVLSALLAATLGGLVWRGWDFTRPLLPVTVVGACLAARPKNEQAEPTSGRVTPESTLPAPAR